MQNKKAIYFEDAEWDISEVGNNHLLAIGIDAYENGIKPLHNAVKDAKDFAELMQEKYLFPSENCICLFDKTATRNEIIETLAEFEVKLKDHDNLLIYYSGHGYHNNGKGYIVPVDAQKGKISSLIYNSTIIDHIRGTKAKHILLIADSCFSGSLLANRDAHIVENETNPVALAQRVVKDASRWAIAAGRIELVSDGFSGLNSPFAEHLLRYLKTSPHQIFPASSLTQYLKENVPQTENQTPIGGPITQTGDKGGEFIFAQKSNETADWKIVLQLNTYKSYNQFLEKHPNGKYAKEARHLATVLKEDYVWQKALDINTISVYYEYCESYSQGKYKSEAILKINQKEEDEAWKTANVKNSVGGYLHYQNTFPNGKYMQEAQNALMKLRRNDSEKQAQDIETLITKEQSRQRQNTKAQEQIYTQPIILEPHLPKVYTSKEVSNLKFRRFVAWGVDSSLVPFLSLIVFLKVWDIYMDKEYFGILEVIYTLYYLIKDYHGLSIGKRWMGILAVCETNDKYTPCNIIESCKRNIIFVVPILFGMVVNFRGFGFSPHAFGLNEGGFFVGYIFPFLLIIVGIESIMLLFNPKSKTIGDMFAKTVVIYRKDL